MGLQFPRGPMRGNQIHAVLREVVIEAVTVIGAIANEMLCPACRSRTELDQRHFMLFATCVLTERGRPW